MIKSLRVCRGLTKSFENMPFTFSSGMFQQDVVASPCLSLKSTNSFFLNIVNTHGKPPLQLQNIKNVTESDKATCSRIHSSMESSDSEAPYLDNRCMCLNKATTPNKTRQEGIRKAICHLQVGRRFSVSSPTFLLPIGFASPWGPSLDHYVPKQREPMHCV